MIDISFEELVEAVQKLRPEQKAALVQTLHLEVTDEHTSLTREQAIAELEALRAAGAFNTIESMRGKYNRPDLNTSDDELNVYLYEIGSEWEEELDDLIDPD
jgi:hypothetical protein